MPTPNMVQGHGPGQSSPMCGAGEDVAAAPPPPSALSGHPPPMHAMTAGCAVRPPGYASGPLSPPLPLHALGSAATAVSPPAPAAPVDVGGGYWQVPPPPQEVTPLKAPHVAYPVPAPASASPARATIPLNSYVQPQPQQASLTPQRNPTASAIQPPVPPKRKDVAHTPSSAGVESPGPAPSPLEAYEASHAYQQPQMIPPPRGLTDASPPGAYEVVPPYQTGGPAPGVGVTAPPTRYNPHGAGADGAEPVEIPASRSASPGSPGRFAGISGSPLRGDVWVETTEPPGAGLPSKPRRVGKKCVQQRPQTASPGDKDFIFGSPPPEKPRRRIGVRKAHILPGDYGRREWRRTSDDIGHGVPGASEGYVAKPETHDERMMHWLKDERHGETAGYNPPGGWETNLPADGYRGRALPNAACMFADEAEMNAQQEDDDGTKRGAAFKSPRAAGGKRQGTPGNSTQRQTFNIFDTADRNTRPKKTFPAGIPSRPPGCGAGAPAPARHQWRLPEDDHPTTVGRDDRPRTLPRTPYQYEPPQPIASAYTIFTRDPFSPPQQKTVATVASPVMSARPHTGHVGGYQGGVMHSRQL